MLIVRAKQQHDLNCPQAHVPLHTRSHARSNPDLSSTPRTAHQCLLFGIKICRARGSQKKNSLHPLFSAQQQQITRHPSRTLKNHLNALEADQREQPMDLVPFATPCDRVISRKSRPWPFSRHRRFSFTKPPAPTILQPPCLLELVSHSASLEEKRFCRILQNKQALLPFHPFASSFSCQPKACTL